MENILIKNMQAGEMFIGTNRSKRLKYDKMYPPIVHVDSLNQMRIAHEGVDVRQYKDKLPEESTQFFSADSDIATSGIENEIFLIKRNALEKYIDQISP